MKTITSNTNVVLAVSLTQAKALQQAATSAGLDPALVSYLSKKIQRATDGQAITITTISGADEQVTPVNLNHRPGRKRPRR